MLVSLILAAALSAASAEVDKTAVAPAAAEAAKPEEAKKVCVYQAQTGTHFKKRICATAEEWEERRRRDAEAMDKLNERRSFCRDADC